MADDLDDEWWLEKNANKPKLHSSSSSSNDESEDDKPVTESESEDSKDSSKEKLKTTKRKADKDVNESAPTKKKKKKNRKRITDELKKNKKQPGVGDDLIQLMQKHYKDKLSAVEWDEIKLDKDTHFFPSSDEDHTPASYLRTVLPKWKKLLASEINVGSPVLLLVTSSAIRAVQLNREIADFKGDKCKTAKLFAKHFKLEEQQKFLAKKVCHVGLGTPNRLRTLLKTDSLHLDNVTAIVLDWNWRDVKSKRLCDIQDIKKELMELLKDYLVPHVQKTKCKIGLL